ncbi:MAG TPA: hypothetical protein VI564_02075 [Candidatus Nanoarchaeia archaeon]|nr:hypothetical protein [Candidatus Nanoarchaeia archaeon]
MTLQVPIVYGIGNLDRSLNVTKETTMLKYAGNITVSYNSSFSLYQAAYYGTEITVIGLTGPNETKAVENLESAIDSIKSRDRDVSGLLPLLLKI